MKTFILITVLVFLLPMVGCGTLYNQTMQEPTLYGGVQKDWAEIELLWKEYDFPEARGLDLLILIDSGISAIADTALIPFTVLRQGYGRKAALYLRQSFP